MGMIMESIRAREHLDFINNVSSLLGSDDDSKEYRIGLAYRAYEDDKKTLAQILMKLS